MLDAAEDAQLEGTITDSEEYLIHITTGNHVAQICLFLLTESRWLPGRLLQCYAGAGRSHCRKPRARLMT